MFVFLACVAIWHIILSRTRLGFATRMIGSNIQAARYSGVPTRRMLVLIYTFSGLVCGVAGIVMLARFNSVRVGHGEAYLLITVLACFLGSVDPFGGLGPQPARRQPASGDRALGRVPALDHDHPLGLGEPPAVSVPRLALRRSRTNFPPSGDATIGEAYEQARCARARMGKGLEP
jgi:hypothetical protein